MRSSLSFITVLEQDIIMAVQYPVLWSEWKLRVRPSDGPGLRRLASVARLSGLQPPDTEVNLCKTRALISPVLSISTKNIVSGTWGAGLNNTGQLIDMGPDTVWQHAAALIVNIGSAVQLWQWPGRWPELSWAGLVTGHVCHIGHWYQELANTAY